MPMYITISVLIPDFSRTLLELALTVVRDSTARLMSPPIVKREQNSLALASARRSLNTQLPISTIGIDIVIHQRNFMIIST